MSQQWNSKCALVIVCGLTATAVAQPPVDGPPKWEVTIAPAERPAFKYALVPAFEEITPGNCVPTYLKCFMEQQRFWNDPEAAAQRQQWLTCPLGELPRSGLGDYGGWALKWADLAARQETCDWQMLTPLRDRGSAVLLPEIQQLRGLADALAVRCRGEIAAGQYGQASKTLTTMFALARHLSEHPTAIGTMVGAAVANIALTRVEEWLQQPGSPNLYWSLTALPRPFTDMRKCLSVERFLRKKEVARFTDRNRPWDEKEALNMIKELRMVAALAEMPADRLGELGKMFQAKMADEKWMAAARTRLVESGMDKDALAKMPPIQVILIDLKEVIDSAIDDATKTALLPDDQSLTAMTAMIKSTSTEPIDVIGAVIVHGLWATRQLHVRIDQRIAAIRAIEAVRDEAARNGRKLPADPSATALPWPKDPVTQKPIGFTLKDGVASIRTETIPGTEARPRVKVGYDISIKK